MNQNNHIRPAFAFFPLLLLTGIAPAADRHVPSLYPTIQAAINASSNGDSVVIEPGVYTENINLNGKNITIKPFNNNFDTIIDGNQAGPVVTFSGNETANCIVRNLIIRNGKAAQGGGIQGNNTLATIKNCTIGANIATGNGGGVHGLSGLMQNCTITLNQAVNGGGISDIDGIIESCKIKVNKATDSGGGAFNIDGTIQYCEIINNEAAKRGGGVSQIGGYLTANLISKNNALAAGPIATPNGFGGGINDAQGTVTQNLIIENACNGDGGGIANSNGLIQNNVLAENSARRGGGISNCTGRIENNTIWQNTASSIGGGCFQLGTLVANAIIYNNSAPADAQWSGGNVPVYSCIQNWPGAQPDIITAPPLLQDPSKGRFYLLPNSPCIDAGKLIPGLNVDFENDSRPYDGTSTPAGDGSDIDIGADEFVPGNIDFEPVFTDAKVKYKGTSPKQKTKIQAKLLIANSGTDTSEAVASVVFYLSNDTVHDPGDVPVGKTLSLKKLKGGKSKKMKCKAKLLNQTVTGQYLIAVVDSTNTTAETDELDNVAVVGPLL